MFEIRTYILKKEIGKNVAKDKFYPTKKTRICRILLSRPATQGKNDR